MSTWALIAYLYPLLWPLTLQQDGHSFIPYHSRQTCQVSGKKILLRRVRPIPNPQHQNRIGISLPMLICWLAVFQTRLSLLWVGRNHEWYQLSGMIYACLSFHSPNNSTNLFFKCSTGKWKWDLAVTPRERMRAWRCVWNDLTWCQTRAANFLGRRLGLCLPAKVRHTTECVEA